MYIYISAVQRVARRGRARGGRRARASSSSAGSRGSGTGTTRSSRTSSARDGCGASTGTSRWPRDPAAGSASATLPASSSSSTRSFPPGRRRVESWLQQQASIPPRARHAAWVADRRRHRSPARAEASAQVVLRARTRRFAGVSVRRGVPRPRHRRAASGSVVERHLDELAPTRRDRRCSSRRPRASRSRAREASRRCAPRRCRASIPATVDCSRLERSDASSCRCATSPPEEVYEVDMITTRRRADDRRGHGHARSTSGSSTIWRRPTITLDGSFGAIVDGRLVSFTLLAANVERGRAFTEYTATLAEYRNRGLAEQVKRASLRWAAANGIRRRVDDERRDERARCSP